MPGGLLAAVPGGGAVICHVLRYKQIVSCTAGTGGNEAVLVT